ncbi:trinucleotide repeat-containing gene 6B protein isoform X3 [Leptopilina heterotoma]|uniref:trinucleotide repeat-containing gene 6B protein isoform X3 n=1 Tax=Leptopilina heterotoma TaxID=63436 RepID=UPI001CA88620|nr:trinucleotide repeat-containing gene 6B protein isoform X3 [Leptopilina heterotoma]
MFPHNSSSHEISTETNAFVQNSKGDVVVLEGSSLSGVGEGNGPEHARYCDIKSINSSMMAAPTSHPEATAANDFLTVLSSHSGEFSSASIGEARQSVAPATTKNPTNHLLTYDNNNKVNNHNNNAEHNHHRKQNTLSLLGQLGSSADNSKSTCKPLSDNKDSFRDLSIRVLKISLYLNVRRGDARYPAGVPSLVRIPKSDYPQRLPHLADSVDNYSLLGSRLCTGDNNNLKANLSFVSNNNSKSVILLSSTSYGDYYLLLDKNNKNNKSLAEDSYFIDVLESTKSLNGNRSLISDLAHIRRCSQPTTTTTTTRNTAKSVFELQYCSNESTTLETRLFPAYAQNFAAHSASSSITLIVSKNEITDHALQSFLESLTRVRESSTSPLGHVTVTELTQRICVPLLIESKRYDNDVGNNYCNNNDDDDDDNNSVRCIGEEMNIRNNNPDVIQDIVNVAVCYKTSCKMTTNVRTLGSQNDGISCTEATMFTVGALSFQDNDKSNKPLNASFKNDKYQVSTKVGHESNSNVKSVSKSSDKSDMSRTIRHDKYNDKEENLLSAVNIPTLTTCEPTMTLNCQSATVTSQTIAVSVPVSQNENCSNDDDDDDDEKILTNVDNDDNNNIDTRSISKIDNDNLISRNESKMDLLSHAPNSLIKSHDKSNNESSQLINYIRTLIPAYQKAYQNDKNNCEIERQRLNVALNTLFSRPLRKCNEILKPIIDYKRRWGIPVICRLIGGGESSLNTSGTANWGTSQATTPNNNNATQSGWGGTPGNPPGNSGPPNNWGGNNVNRPQSITGNPNQNNQGPPGNQNNQGNVNKTNNANPPQNSQTGPPTSQSNNTVQGGNQNNASWPQGKPNNPVGPGPNQTTQNNNSNNVPQQQSSTPNANNNQISNSNQGPVAATTPTTTNPSTKQQLEQLNTMREALFSQDGWGCQHVNQDTNWDVPTSPEPSLTKDGVPMWKPAVNNGTDLWEVNLRNGGQPPPQPQAKTPWGHTPSTNIGGTWGEDDEAADSSNMWTGAPAPSQPNTPQWPGATGNQTGGSNWGDPRIDPRDPRDIRSVDPREMRDPRDHRMSLDPREHIRVIDPMARDPRMADMRGDPRGISGRLNGAGTDTMWGQPPGPPHHQMGHQHPSGPPTKMINPSSMNQWSGPPQKEMMPGGKPSGWEEPSPPTQRRSVQNYDDGTSLWGNPGPNQRTMPGTKVSHWKDLPVPNIARGAMQCPPGMPQNRMPGQPGMKPDVGGPMWSHPSGPGGRNGSWGDGPHETAAWDETKGPTTWNEPQLNPASWGGPAAHKPKPMGPTGSWADSDMEPTSSWGHPSKQTLTKEIICNSREFRSLCELGYKKEDVEAALRSREMNRDEAQELLNQVRPLDQWRRHEAHSGYELANQATSGPSYPRFNHVAQQMSFPPASRTPQNQPSTQQLRMLVQQIQLAVQEGYLNHQILNQPLAPQTLILLNQLLQQIKVLQQLHQQQNVQSSVKGNNQTLLQINIQITKTKQQIANLQNQIAIQQATYMKQQQQQQHPAAPSQSSDYYKTPVHDPISALQNSFSDLSMNKEQPPVSQQQSRLNQWKLPSLDKDGDSVVNEFSRAPGTTSKPPQAPGGLTQSHSSPNMNPLLGQSDGPWSTRLGESGWPDAGNSDSTDGKDWQPGGAAFTDLVPEFEPGKPWKGTQMKSIEDDPSITPGSVVRSPLSLAAIKDPDALFSSSSKSSPPPQSVNAETSIPSLSNSTWSFNPPATTPSAFTSAKNTWGESAPPPTAVTSELWGAPMNKARGPPPGLSSKGSIGNASNGWSGLSSVGRSASSWGLQSGGGNSGWVSTWLLLKNLTPQIDGSTLKTLCMQHGPVQDFRLYLNHGIALTKYSSRDEAIKAQGALNNCVLGNTTIFAESPGDSEVHTLLQQLSHGGQQQTSASGNSGWGLRPTNKTAQPPDTWGGSSSQLWGAPPSSNSLWSNAGLDSSDQQRATPSSLNSYLPGDLLGDVYA